jgi:AraC-like DNA-binding protein
MPLNITQVKFPDVLLAPFRLASFFDYHGRMGESSYHRHDAYQVVLVLCGNMAFHRPGSVSLELEARDVVVIPPGLRHAWEIRSETICSTVAVLHDPLPAERYGQMADVLGGGAAGDWWKAALAQETLDTLVPALRQACGDTAPGSGGVLYAQLMLFLAHVARARTAELEAGTAAPVRDPVRRSLDYIEAHYHETVSLDDLATAAGLGVSRFSEVFRASLGRSPMRYLAELRLRRAEALLAFSDLNVKRIAGCVGYRSVHYFSRAFRGHAGLSPSAFRRRRSGS